MGLFSFLGRNNGAGAGWTRKAVEDLIEAVNGRAIDSIDTSTAQGQARAYELCSAVSAVINTICTYIRQFELWQVDAKGERVDGTEYIDMLARPNPYQSLPDFVAAIELAKLLYGKALIWRDEEYGDLYVLPNASLAEVAERGRVSWIKPNGDVAGYTLRVENGSEVRLELDDIRVLQDVSADLGRVTGGRSRLYGKSDIINAYVAGYAAMAEITRNRGALGIVSMMPSDSSAIYADQEQVADAERKLTSKYGLLREQFRYIVTSRDSKFTKITADLSDLQLDATRIDCRNEIARTYNVPPVLLDSANATFANLATAERSLYQNVIDSDAQAIFHLLNDIRGLYDVRVVPHYDHLPCFQQQRKEEAAAFATFATAITDLLESGVITTDEARERLATY